MIRKEQDVIDFVVLWVDGNDPKWRREKNEQLKLIGYPTDTRDARYRDWNNMMYWFRGVEKFAPWVHRIHFVTYGHLPKWLNTECSKLNIVNHHDFIPEKYLPNFNSAAIEINIHRIPELSEKFVYFNDDMFLINHVSKKDFFVHGKPVTFGCLGKRISEERRKEDTYFGMLATNGEVISRIYNKHRTILCHPFLFFNKKYGKQVLANVRAFFDDSYVLDSTHMPQAFTKKSFETMWEKAPDIMHYTSLSRFRRGDNVNQDLFKSQQVLSGNFYPQARTIGMPLFFSDEKKVKDTIENQRFKMCCVADDVSDVDFDAAVERLRGYFEKILSEKSQFEL